MRANKAILFLIFLILQANVIAQEVIGPVPLIQNENLSFLPASKSSFVKNSDDENEVFISREQYLISYNRKNRLLNWAEWRIENSDLGDTERTNKFAADADLENYLSRFSEHVVSLADYKGSCFDRGHQVPSADRTNNEENNKMTFVLSNMIPQTAHLNRVIWKNFEKYARELVTKKNKTVYVIAGPIFDEDFGHIGIKKDIPIPSKDFKILIVLEKGQTIKDADENTEIISVVMPNKLKSGKKPLDDLNELCTNKVADEANLPTNNNWQKYQTSIDEIEKLTGYQILPIKLKRPLKAR